MTTYELIGLIFAAAGIVTLAALAYEAIRHRTLDLAYLPLTSLCLVAVRVMAGGLFFFSGFVKANDYTGFAYKLEEYFYVFAGQMPALSGFFRFFIPWAGPLAWFISVFEMALAVAILLGWRMRLTAWLTMLMMIFFTVLTAYSHVTGAVTDCGCFGDALKLKPFESFLKDVILTGMLIPLFLVRGSVKPVPSARAAGIATLAVFVLTGAYSWYCHEHLPVVDYLPYKKGVDLRRCTTEDGPEGIPKCKDFYPSFSGEEIDLFEGRVMLMVIYKAQAAPAAALDAAGALIAGLQGSGVQPVFLTSSDPAIHEQLVWTHGLACPVGYMDETVLKTMIRSNPGFLLLRDGVVLEKWHYNDAPDAEAVKRLAGN
ncbi:MAG: DoxX family protein [Bacteroidia bacterium]|nr:DoxX family protein [Bacteroidia bacterium]